MEKVSISQLLTGNKLLQQFSHTVATTRTTHIIIKEKVFLIVGQETLEIIQIIGEMIPIMVTNVDAQM